MKASWWPFYPLLPRSAARLSSERRLSHSIASLLARSSFPPSASSSSSPNLPTHLLSASSKGVNTSSSGAPLARSGLRLRLRSERANSSSSASETGSRSSSAAGSRRGETPDLDRDKERNFNGGASDREDEAEEIGAAAAAVGAGGGGAAGAGVGFLGTSQLKETKKSPTVSVPYDSTCAAQRSEPGRGAGKRTESDTASCRGC